MNRDAPTFTPSGAPASSSALASSAPSDIHALTGSMAGMSMGGAGGGDSTPEPDDSGMDEIGRYILEEEIREFLASQPGLSEDEKNWLFAKMLQEGGYGPAGGHFVDEEDESNEAVEELSTFYQDVLGSEGGMDVLVAPPPSATAAAADAAPATAYIPSSASRLSAGAAEFRPGAWAAAAAFVPAASAPAPAPASAGYSWVDPYAQPAAVEHPQYAQQQYGHLQYPQQRQPQATWADHARGSAGPAAAAMPAHGGGGGGMWSSGPATSQPAPAAWPAPYAAGPAPATMAPRPALQQSGAQPPRADWQVSLGSLM